MTNRQREIEESEKKFLEYFRIKYPYKRPAAQHNRKPDPDKILSLSDLHEPYSHEGVLDEVETKHKDAGVLIAPGDIGDYYSKSRFRKTRHVEFRDEVRAIFYRLEWMATHWPDVRVMLGNHDTRPEKAMLAAIGPQIDLLILTEQNLLLRLASYFDNVTVVGQQLDGSGEILTHFYQHGDILFCHAEISRKAQETVFVRLSEYLHRWGRMIGLKPFRVIAQGHNHRDLKKDGGSEYWFGLPTASNPFALGFDYIWNAKVWGEPPVCGYTIFRQSQGETDYNASQNFRVEHQNPPRHNPRMEKRVQGERRLHH